MGLAERVFVGLPPACPGLDADGAAEMRGHLDATHQAVGLLGRPGTDPAGSEPAGHRLAGSPDAHGGRPADGRDCGRGGPECCGR